MLRTTMTNACWNALEWKDDRNVATAFVTLANLAMGSKNNGLLLDTCLCDLMAQTVCNACLKELVGIISNDTYREIQQELDIRFNQEI